MSGLQQFLNDNPVDGLMDEVPISDRFKDKEGNLLKFKISAMSNEEMSEYRKRNMSIRTKGRNKVDFDSSGYINDIVINHTVDPSFKDADSIKKLGCHSPKEYLNNVLLSGEIDTLAQKIQELSGFKSLDDMVDDVKN